MGMFLVGILIYVFFRILIKGFFTVGPNERAVKTSFGKANRAPGRTSNSPLLSNTLNEDERTRYDYPLLAHLGPGLHFKFPWEKVYKVSVATETINMATDPESYDANHKGTQLEAVTKDQLNIGLKGQIRFRVSEQNLYAFVFGIKDPLTHVMGFFVSILREKIANFSGSSPVINLEGMESVESISINDFRKNLREINDGMVKDCESSTARYGVVLEASLITGIDPPHEVESALAAINTAHNNVSSEISLAKATADQTIVLSKRAVEIETLKAQAEVEPLVALADQLLLLKKSGPDVLKNFVRNSRLELLKKANRIIHPSSEI